MATSFKGGQPIEGEVGADKLFVLTHAFPGKGKSEFAASFPPPLHWFNFDRSASHIIEKLPAWYSGEYEQVVQDVDNIGKGVAQAILNKYEGFLRDALKTGEGTFITDGYDILWEFVKIAKLPNNGGDNQNYAKEYADANTYMYTQMRRMSLSPLQICLTTTSGYMWAGATQETRKVKQQGFKHTDRYITHNVYLFTPEDYDTPMDIPTEGKGLNHKAYISVSKVNEELAGTVVPNLSFRRLWKAVYGEAWPDEEKLYVPGGMPSGN